MPVYYPRRSVAANTRTPEPVIYSSSPHFSPHAVVLVGLNFPSKYRKEDKLTLPHDEVGGGGGLLLRFARRDPRGGRALRKEAAS